MYMYNVLGVYSLQELEESVRVCNLHEYKSHTKYDVIAVLTSHMNTIANVSHNNQNNLYNIYSLSPGTMFSHSL